MTVSAMEIQGLLWQKIPAFSLVPGRVGADLSKLQVISGIGRLQEHDAVFGIQMFLDRVQGFLRKPFLYANACEDAEALGFDKDLTFFTFPGADLVAVGIVGPGGTIPRPSRNPGLPDRLLQPPYGHGLPPQHCREERQAARTLPHI